MRGAAPHAQKKERVYQNANFLGVETWRAALLSQRFINILA